LSDSFGTTGVPAHGELVAFAAGSPRSKRVEEPSRTTLAVGVRPSSEAVAEAPAAASSMEKKSSRPSTCRAEQGDAEMDCGLHRQNGAGSLVVPVIGDGRFRVVVDRLLPGRRAIGRVRIGHRAAGCRARWRERRLVVDILAEDRAGSIGVWRSRMV